jgi:hypothetical protein
MARPSVAMFEPSTTTWRFMMAPVNHPMVGNCGITLGRRTGT